MTQKIPEGAPLSDEEVAENLRHLVLDHFEAIHAKQGDHIEIDWLFAQVDETITRTEVREWVDSLSDTSDLWGGRLPGGQKVVLYMPLHPTKKAIDRCHAEADENGNVSPTLIKLALQQYVVLDQHHRDEVLQWLLKDHRRAIEKTTLRRAQVDQILHDALVTFKVAPEPS